MKTLARQRDTAEILQRLKNLRADAPSRWGRMSAHQMVCHLSDAMSMATGEKPVSQAGGPWQKTIVKWFALYAPLPWPGGLPTTPEIDQECGGTRPSDFSADVARVETQILFITTQKVAFDWQPHPVFGRMSEAAWLRWAYVHTDHHLRQFGV